MLFFYVRHGDPIYNPDSLTPQGHLQAQALAKRLALYGIDRIYASTSQRAQMTAEPTGKLLNKEVIPLDFAHEGYAWRDLTVETENKKEWIFKSPETKALFHSEEVIKLADEWYTHPAFADGKFGEGMKRIKTCSDEFFASLGYAHEDSGRYRVEKESDERVALFAHQGFGLAFLSVVLDIPYPTFSTTFDFGHTGLTVIEFKNDGGYAYPRVLTFSNDSHIYREGLPTKYQNQIYF